MTVAIDVAIPLMEGENISPSRVKVTTQLNPKEKKNNVIPMRGK